MKRDLVLSLFAVMLFVIFSSLVYAQEVFEWRKKDITNSPWSEIYSLSIQETNCHVYIGNGNEVRIITEDRNYYGKLISQCILLKDGDLKFEGLSIRDNENSWIFKSNGGYSIFQEKYLNYAMNLPPEVRSKFGGYFGIK